eukprot:14948045-Ditylum_brightwellii.AAC.1
MPVGKDGEPPVIPTPRNCYAHCCDTTGLFCASCQAGKGERTGTGAKKEKEVLPGALKIENSLPRQKVATDQYALKVKGLLLHTKGKESAANMHSGGTIFVDHASQLICIANQVSLIASYIVQSKKDFERFTVGRGVWAQQYHGDNCVFKSVVWGEHCEAMQQLPTEMSGVGAHHQNAVSEQSVGTVARSARTMLLHATFYWPE